MRLFVPTLFTARGYATTPTGSPNGPPRGEAGADGDQLLADLAGGGPDVNPELTGRLKHLVYDEMAKTDPTVKSVLLFLGLPVRSANWGLNPKDDSPIAKVIRDVCCWNLGLEGWDGELDLSWDETLQQALTMLKFGPSIEEIVWGDVREWYDADGDRHLVRPIARLAPRLPTTVERFELQDGRPYRLEQNVPGAKPVVNTDGFKLTYLVFEREAGRWDGVSLLRPMWGAWRLKKHLIVSTGINWDRFGGGTPVIWHPPTPDGEQRAREIGRNYRHHERGYVHFPTDGPGPSGRPESDWFMEILNAASSMADPTPLLRWLSEQEAEAGLQQALRQGLGQTGARASAETQIDPFFLAVEAVADQIRRARSRQVIRKLVEVNFGVEAAEKLSPVLTVSKIQMRSMEAVGRYVGMLAQDAGLDFTDLETVNDLRGIASLPELDEDQASTQLPRDRLVGMLQAAGLDAETLAQVAARLPTPGAAAEGNGLVAA